MIKQRNIALCIVFSIITFGIYALYWFVCLTNDANQESGQTDATSGGVALLLTIVTCNIYGWFYCICAYAGHCKQICRGYTSDEYRIWSADLQSAAIWSAGI